MRDDRRTVDPPNEPKADEAQGEHRQSRGRMFTLIAAGVTLIVVIAAGFAITIAAGRVPQDRPVDHPPATETSSLLGPPGDNRNNNEGNNG